MDKATLLMTQRHGHGTKYDYTNQAWVVDGKYVGCNHPSGMDCKCYGKLHAGQLALAVIENTPRGSDDNS